MKEYLEKDFIEKVVEIVKDNSQLALGCTEPVAVAFNTAVASKNFKWELEELEVEVSNNIFKNGKSVIVPGTTSAGLDLAASLGFIGGDSEKGFMVLKGIDKQHVQKAEELLNDGLIKLSTVSNTADVYVRSIAKGEGHEVEVITENGHIALKEVKVDGDLVFSKKDSKDGEEELSLEDYLKDLTLVELREIVEAVSIEDIQFIKDGIKQNRFAAEEGLKNNYSLNVGSTIEKLAKEGKLKLDTSRKARMLTAAAADMRMGGGACEITTSGGSGNQGIGVLVTTAIVGEDFDVEEERIIRAGFFGNLVNSYIKIYAGKLSGMCGCAIGAGIGATIGITWMLGGNDEQIAGACNNMFANITGMICDGAKDTCALKLATSAEEAVISSLLALSGSMARPKIGIIGDTVEQTVKNIGLLSRKGFSAVDDVILEVIENN